MRYFACLLVAFFTFFVIACSGGDIDPSVDLYEYPGDEEGRVIIDPDDFQFEFRFDHEPRNASTECRFEDEDWFDCDSPYFFDQDSEEYDLSEGYLRFQVRAYDEDSTSPSESLELLVLYDFDFQLDDAQQYQAGSTDTPFYFPDEYTASCGRSDCELFCYWEADGLDAQVDAPCSLDEPFMLTFPDEDLENAYLQIEACATNFGGDQDDEYCQGPKTYLFYPPPPAFVQLEAGSRHTCGLVGDGSIWCWGRNNAGQVGVGGATSQPVLEAEKVLYRNWVSLSAGGEHTCAINEAGALYCWGDNASNQLGFSPINAGQPEEVDAGPWSVVSAGNRHTCAIDDDGGLFCWGEAGRGRLGNPSAASDGAMYNVALPAGATSGWIDVSAGDEHTCAIAHRSGGGRATYCWGDASDGKLGNNSESGSYDTPQEVVGNLAVMNADELTTGTHHTCAIASSVDHETYCWGRGARGRLGNGTEDNRPVPRRISSGDDPAGGGGENHDNHISVAAGDSHSCAVHEEGSIFCWGENFLNQLGSGLEDNWLLTPVRAEVDPRLSFDQISVGEEHSCAINSSGTVYCWGDGNDGQLGIGADRDAEVPTRLSWPQGEFIPTPHAED